MNQVVDMAAQTKKLWGVDKYSDKIWLLDFNTNTWTEVN
jgi:hypothetical protein